MPSKKKSSKARDLQRKRTIIAVVNNLEKEQTKLEAGLKKLKKDLKMFRHYCD